MSRNLLSRAGKKAARDTMRAMLLRELIATGWHLTHTAERLGMGTTSQPVLREIKRLELVREYEAAKSGGLIPRTGHRARFALPPDP